MINITIEDRNGEQQDVEIPEEISLSLMEVLRASGYNIGNLWRNGIMRNLPCTSVKRFRKAT